MAWAVGLVFDKIWVDMQYFSIYLDGSTKFLLKFFLMDGDFVLGKQGPSSTTAKSDDFPSVEVLVKHELINNKKKPCLLQFYILAITNFTSILVIIGKLKRIPIKIRNVGDSYLKSRWK